MGCCIVAGGGRLSWMKRFRHSYDDIISIQNLLAAWGEFILGKRKRKDVQEFGVHLMDNILKLHTDLKNNTYTHGVYEAFNISDPKPRNIHKATVRDRLLHHALSRELYSFFDTTFVFHSYSCRKEKGTHRAITNFTKMARGVSVNHTKTCWVLKCDIKKFFASIDHTILIKILEERIVDTTVLGLLQKIVSSFDSGTAGKGLPLGNLTSQLLVNIYMNEFGQYLKQTLKVKYYIRYADDFVLLSDNRDELIENLQSIGGFLESKLKLTLHPQKVSISTFASGVDFLGWVHFPHHHVLRTVTKRRVILRYSKLNESSHQGLLCHGDAYGFSQELTTLMYQ